MYLSTHLGYSASADLGKRFIERRKVL